VSEVSVQIVTFNSETEIEDAIASVSRQTWPDVRIRILDNASSDGTREAIRRAVAGIECDVVESPINTGFAAGHNRLAGEFPAPYVLFLNPDAVLEPDFIARLVEAVESDPHVGSATGKLLRLDGRTIDSTGIVMTRNQRHLDRGAGEPDDGRYDTGGEIFGPSGAAALYRSACLDDVAAGGRAFDEDFFAYREDADLAWRCRLLGWRSLYVPSAVGRHRRRVTPERRSQLPAEINMHSVKNRFLLRINNMTPALYRKNFVPITIRDCAVIGWVLLREWSSIPALTYLLRHWARLMAKRRNIQRRVRVGSEEMDRWFA